MSVSSGQQVAAGEDDDYEIRACCPYPYDVVANFIREETEWLFTNDEIKFLMTHEGLVAVCATAKNSPQNLIGITLAVPTHSPFFSASRAYSLTYVIVAKSHRRRGIARRIVSEVIRICEEERR